MVTKTALVTKAIPTYVILPLKINSQRSGQKNEVDIIKVGLE